MMTFRASARLSSTHTMSDFPPQILEEILRFETDIRPWGTNFDFLSRRCSCTRSFVPNDNDAYRRLCFGCEPQEDKESLLSLLLKIPHNSYTCDCAFPDLEAYRNFNKTSMRLNFDFQPRTCPCNRSFVPDETNPCRDSCYECMPREGEEPCDGSDDGSDSDDDYLDECQFCCLRDCNCDHDYTDSRYA